MRQSIPGTVDSRSLPYPLLALRKAQCLAALSAAVLLINGCSKNNPKSRPEENAKSQIPPKLDHASEKPPARAEKPAEICTKPHLAEREWIDYGLRVADPGARALSSQANEAWSSLRLPRAIKPNESGWIPYPVRDRRMFLESISDGPKRIATCDPAHPRAMLRDVYFAWHDMRLDYDEMGRNVELVISNCASGIMVNPTGKEKRRVLHHKVVDDGAYCELELNGYDDPDRQDYTLDHEFNVMHGRRVNGVFEYQYLVYRVPEQDWPYVADVIRASARSFKPVWGPTKPKASKQAKRKKKGRSRKRE